MEIKNGIGSGAVEHVSSFGFDATLDRLMKAIKRAGLTIFARIDHAATARKANLTMPPTVVMIYGHAEGGTPLMLAAPQAALDLPLRVLVRENKDGRTFVAFHPIAPMMLAAGVPSALANLLEPAQNILMEQLRA